MMGVIQCFSCIIALLLMSAFKIDSIEIKRNILGPALPGRPFVVTWNVASERCEEKYGIPLDLSDFDIVHNPDKSSRGSTLTIFYSSQLGLFPHFDSDGQPINGGLPQQVDLYAHLDKVSIDIKKSIPDPDFRGLAVIDWEAWLPLWSQVSWGAMLIYQNKSIEKVETEHPDWTHEKIVSVAKSEYEAGSKTLIEFTLALAKLMRPRALWGFYLYPDCYNYNKYGNKSDLRCSNHVMGQNDLIQWVFDDSTGLYPSVYLGNWFKDNKTAIYYVGYRVLEAMRVDDNRRSEVSAPVFVYHSLTYRKVPEFVDFFDLRDSIGVSSLLGASGMVIWGGYNVANSVEECQKLSDYISTTLGPYVKATSDAATLCSYEYCSGHGRCVLSHFLGSEKGGSEQSYLTVSEATKEVMRLNNVAYKAFDLSFNKDASPQQYITTCQCYDKWTGKYCLSPKI